jgi:hypothetical protein
MTLQHRMSGILAVRTAFVRDAMTGRQLFSLLAPLGVLFLLDIFTTYLILQLGGIELNPLMAGVVQNPLIHLAVKTAALLMVVPVSLVAEKYVKGSGTALICTIITMYLFVLVNNAFELLPQILR